MKLLLDTNALIDHIAQRKPYCDSIEKLCIASYFGDVELWVPVQSFLDALYALRKFAPQRALRDSLMGCLEFFKPCGSQARDLLPALKLEWPDVEDYMIACCATHVNADYVVTRDSSGFERSKVKFVSPDEAVRLLNDMGFDYSSVMGNFA